MTTTSTDGPLTIAEVLERSTAYLGERGSATPRLDAELLMAHSRGCERIELYTWYDRPLTGRERDVAREAVARRGRREPVAHILGSRG
ncbi:MAG: peptide chain release factor N(5)-glutamine methyltransferase, partial [Miltoncostaeaceae bacterium]